MVLSKHAHARKCQRSLPSYVLSAAYEFGTCRPVRGAVRAYTLDRTAVQLASEVYSRRIASTLTRYLGVYVLVGENEKVVTAARGHCRGRRNR
ncbi:MAG: hypothetical protein ACO1O4_14435 [Devosia sp.]